MRLSDQDIIASLDKGHIVIEPRPSNDVISGVSVDLRLGRSFRVFKDHARPYVDVSASREEINQTLEAIMSEEIIVADDEAFFLHPGELALAVTKESVTIPADLVGWLDGRSSL
ncbi:MAG: dCTP deaminase, partial [Oceanospirillaceae bacterium]|nr:dCTP deaminase [Oceanospirillaceae bacterium]